MADETQSAYIKRLALWGLYALAIVGAMAANALIGKYLGASGKVPEPPPPIVIEVPPGVTVHSGR